MGYFLFLLVLFLLAYLSLKLRNINKRAVSEAYEYQPKDSPFSKNIVELISTAGGIYISLTLALSFLKIDYAPMYEFLEVEFDFLAAIALALAIMQPVFIFMYHKIKLK